MFAMAKGSRSMTTILIDDINGFPLRGIDLSVIEILSLDTDSELDIQRINREANHDDSG